MTGKDDGAAPAGAPYQSNSGGKASQRPKRRRQPLKATPQGLERSALYYLERYDSSSGHLRRLLHRKVQLSARVHDTDPEEGVAAVERLIARLTGLGLLNDGRYARERVRSLRGRGASTAMIRAKLRAKSLPAGLIDAALSEEASNPEERELLAALRYAQRRRLGPFRLDNRTERRDRDLAALGRQGFPYETARRVIDSENPAALQAEIGDD